MNSWILPIFIFLVWSIWVVACAAQVAEKQASEGVPEKDRSGTSILPGMPVFPLAFWGVSWIIDYWLAPWGSFLVAGFHVLFACFLIRSIVRSSRTLKVYDEPV